MTQKEKSLLLQDLCARLPYGVKIRIRNDYVRFQIEEHELCAEHLANVSYNIENLSMRPYLRPMSSMTEEEKETYYNLCYEEEREELEFGEWAARIHYHDTIDSIDYLNSIHIDYRGLIEKGIALEAPKDMYN